MNARGAVLIVVGVLLATQVLGGHLWARLNVTGNPG